MKELSFAIKEWFKAENLCEKAYKLKLKNKEMRSYWNAERKAKNNIKKIIKNNISQWCETNQFENSYNRIEIRFIDSHHPYNSKIRHPEIILDFVSIFSSKGSLGKIARWLNKISIGEKNNIVSHIARTDENYLGEENAERFAKFIVQLKEAIAGEVDLAWNLSKIVVPLTFPKPSA